MNRLDGKNSDLDLWRKDENKTKLGLSSTAKMNSITEHCAAKEEDEQTVVVVLKFASTMFDRTSEPTTLAAF